MAISAGFLNVANILHNSRVNGPGNRTVLHLAGCTLGCVGCFNPELWKKDAGTPTRINDVLSTLRAARAEHLTISGGEPLQQAEAVLELLHRLRDSSYCDPRIKTVMLFSGYYLHEISAGVLAMLGEYLDAGVFGRYEPNSVLKFSGVGPASSTNQHVVLFTNKLQSVEAQPAGVEVLIAPNATAVTTGFPSKSLIGLLSAEKGVTQ